jgi:putative ABC transport system permease protein
MRSLRSRASPAVYHSYAATPARELVLHVRTAGDPAGLGTALREAVADVDPELPVASVVDLRDALAASMGETRTIGRLVGVFAALALVLAAVGLYGVVSFGVSRRVREMGIRTALGAEPGSLVRLVLGRGLGITAVGVLAGLGVSWAVGRAFSGLLFGVPPADPLTIGGAALTLVATAMLAAWLPARRASRVDAAVALRQAGGA